MSDLYLGCHISIANGFEAAAKDAVSIGANSFQFFTRNPRGGSAKALDENDLKAYEEIAQEHNFGPLLAHAPYTMNLASAKERVREFALEVLLDDYERIKRIKNARYLFHPGSHVGQGVEQGIEYIVTALNKLLKDDQGPWIMLEGMSGKGTEIGYAFDELRQIIQGVNHSKRLGVCLDTCHMHSAGYDIVNDLPGVLKEFDEKIGLDKVRGVHINDNMNQFNSRKDRHAKIGEGSIGTEAIVKFMQTPEFKGLPFNLETPNELDGFAAEIKLLRSLV